MSYSITQKNPENLSYYEIEKVWIQFSKDFKIMYPFIKSDKAHQQHEVFYRMFYMKNRKIYIDLDRSVELIKLPVYSLVGKALIQ